MANSLKKQFEFSVIIEADDLFEAQTKAKELFKELYEETSWQQVFRLKPVEEIHIEKSDESFEL